MSILTNVDSVIWFSSQLVQNLYFSHDGTTTSVPGPTHEVFILSDGMKLRISNLWPKLRSGSGVCFTCSIRFAFLSMFSVMVLITVSWFNGSAWQTIELGTLSRASIDHPWKTSMDPQIRQITGWLMFPIRVVVANQADSSQYVSVQTFVYCSSCLIVRLSRSTDPLSCKW